MSIEMPPQTRALGATVLAIVLLLLVACSGEPTSPEGAVRRVIAKVQANDWPGYEAMALNQADFLALSIGSTGGHGSYTDEVLRPQDRNRIEQEFGRVVASRALLGYDPDEFQVEARLSDDELWIADVLLPDGRPTGVKMALRWWKEGYKVTRIQAPR